jgi:antitoxin (DNA-binding transcriptional repressor) of toxin-antitoxin stability system
MSTLSIQDIEQDPLAFLRRVEAGEALLIMRGEYPVVEVRPVSGRSAELRPYGLCAGKFYLPDDFNAPLPEEVLKQFEGA